MGKWARHCDFLKLPVLDLILLSVLRAMSHIDPKIEIE